MPLRSRAAENPVSRRRRNAPAQPALARADLFDFDLHADSIALRLILPINWTIRRLGMVQVINGVTW